MNPARIMQQSFCYWKQKWSVSVSWGYAVQIYPHVLTPKELEMPLQTFHTWRSWSNGPFIFNVRPVSPDPCQQPVVFYLDSIEGARKGEVVTTYKKFVGKVKNKCPTGVVGIEKVVVSAAKMDHNEWKQVRLFPSRLSISRLSLKYDFRSSNSCVYSKTLIMRDALVLIIFG